jgi:hypothetical protein
VAQRGVGSLIVRALVALAAAAIVVIAAVRSWPLVVLAPPPDGQRVADLQRLSHAIAAYRLEHDVLPATLSRLPSPPAAPVRLSDPVTGRAYDYRPLGSLAYELCAQFDSASTGPARDFWWHDAGRHCYSLETRQRPRPAPPAQAPVPAASPAAPDALPAAPDAGAPAAPDPAPAPESAPPRDGAGGPTPPAR